jgi:hypothetical protein
LLLRQPFQTTTIFHAILEANPMSSWFKLTLQMGVVAVSLSACSCFAKGTLMNTGAEESSQEQSWNREQKSTLHQESRAIVQQKAEARSAQRMDRMATSAWYGVSNSRPSATSTPFTARYGSVWEMPGGRPYSWYPAYARPNYVFWW